MFFRAATLPVVVVVLSLSLNWVRAAGPDKSGVKPSAISLPSGAGSIEGLGESFEPQLNTGSSGYGVAIGIPPGRAGLQPKVRLAYSSNLGNSTVGLGWSFEFPTIKRQTDKGFPTYSSADVFLSGGEELVPLSDGTWRCENESAFQRFRQIDTDEDGRPDAWEMTERSGVRHLFGRHRSEAGWSVVEHPNPTDANARAFDRTYLWALDSTIDLHGNRVDYAYLRGEGILYPSRIAWSHFAVGGTTNYHEVLFLYEDRPDAFDDYRPTFSVRTAQRLKKIEIRSFYAGESHLVRAYELDYARPPGEPGLDLGVSLLRQFTQFDRSGTTNNYLPPLRFSYTPFATNDFSLRPILLPPPLDLADSEGRTQLVDFNGDGLPDLLRTGPFDQRYSLNLGETLTNDTRQLAFGGAVILPPVSGAELNLPDATLTDYDGDGLADLVRLETQGSGEKRVLMHANRARLDDAGRPPPGFSEIAARFPDAPPFISFSDPNVRQMDVNFDKTSDWVRIDGQAFYFYWQEKSGKWHELRRPFLNFDDVPGTLAFSRNGKSNPDVHLTDMNGDRLPDLVQLDFRNGTPSRLTVSYWPYCGLGRWGARRQAGPTFDVFDVAGTDDILVQDLNGDGLADLAIMRPLGDRSELELRLNLAGQRWSEPITVTGLPRHQPRDPNNPTAFRQADLNGSGSTDLLWFNRNSLAADSDWHWLELLPHGKPNLLTQIDNGLGKRTGITYGSSTEDLVRAREAGFPWQTFSAFPVQVVRRLRTTCGQDLDGLDDSGRLVTTDQYVSELRYRDAFYDAFEREFRGFAFAERVDYGDDFLSDTNLTVMAASAGWDRTKTPTGQVSGPSLVTRFRYLTGAADGTDNDEYPPGWTDPALRDEISPRGGREEEILKGLQVWQEKVDPWVLHDPAKTADFDRGCFLAVTSSDTAEHQRMTPDDFVYSRARQEWTVRRLYRPTGMTTNLVPDGDGVFRPRTVARPSPPGRFESGSPSVFVVGSEGGSGRSVSFAFVSRIETEVIEANGLLSSALGHPSRPPVLTLARTDYDDYGNVVRQEDHGVVSDPGVDDERFTTTEYALGGEAFERWTLSEPSRVRVTDEQGRFVAQKDYFYDGQPYVGLAAEVIGTRALLHRTVAFVNGETLPPALTEQSNLPGDPRLPANLALNVERSEYDAFGNPVRHLDPLGDPANPEAGHWREMGFDPAFGTYVVREVIGVGNGSPALTATAAYDPGFGVLTNFTDFNANATAFEYDSFARLVAIVKPGDSPAFPTAFFAYEPADPLTHRLYTYDRTGNLTLKSSGVHVPANRVITRLRETTGEPGVVVSVGYSDGCGRTLAQVTEGDEPGQWIVTKATSYNRRQAAQSNWLPYTLRLDGDDSAPPQFSQLWPAGRPPETDAAGHPVFHTDQFADPLGRSLRIINPPETAVANAWVTQSRTVYLPLETVLFDEEDSDPASPYYNTPHVQLKDGLDRLIGVIERTKLNDDGTVATTPVDWLTRYEYDLNDNLTHITDSQGNQKWFRYDGLKRKLFMNDPDRGVMIYTYDDASNLRSTLDAKGQAITYTYDGVNRLLTEDYLDAAGRSPDVRYFYDVAVANIPVGDGSTATARNVKGMLAHVQDLSGEEHTSYDTRGRVEYVIKRLPDPQFLSLSAGGEGRGEVALVSYRTAFAYDSLDRVTSLTYPDSDRVGYRYNARNLLTRISGGPLAGQALAGSIISNITYRASDQLAQIDYGNGVRTTYDYDPRLRLNTLVTRHLSLATELLNFTYEFDGVSNIKAIRDQRPGVAVPGGDKRRNTQLFQYDDLYRITRAQYSFALPGAADANNGVITYRYDRIGNMLNQGSDIVHNDRGVSVTDMGNMSYGGPSGRMGRIGRTTADPGPHALSTIQHPVSGIRSFPYDANGNMAVIDGLTNTWDFKDRLIRVEDTNMVARYTYDYTDRRVLKRVWKKNSLSAGGEGRGEVESVLYPDKYFEVREHDAPVKYVWNGNTRVARVTGSLTTPLRTQRLRVYPGYNLVSLAVTATNGFAQLTASGSLSAFGGEGQGEVVRSAQRWNATTLGWEKVAADETLPAGTVLWLNLATNANLAVTGTYAEPANQTLQPGVNFVSGGGLQPLVLTDALPEETAVWNFDASGQRWSQRLGSDVTGFFDVPAVLPPSSALFARSEVVSTLTVPESALQVRYYHQDHLGSSSVLTDTTGALVSETANYAFGFARNEFLPRNLREPYGFTQKERDEESLYSYFSARFQISTLARFSSVDSITRELEAASIGMPQSANGYSYCVNRPVRLIDPTGQSGMRSETKDSVMLDSSPKGFAKYAGMTVGVCGYTGWSLYSEGNSPGQTLQTAVVLGLEQAGDTSGDSIVRALGALNAALAQKKEFKVNVDYMLKSETILRQKIADAIAKNGAGSSGDIRFDQADYKNMGSKFAYGGLDMKYSQDKKTGLVTVTVADKYQWSPQEWRTTKCLHMLAKDQVKAGKMTEPMLVGSGQISPSDLPEPSNPAASNGGKN